MRYKRTNPVIKVYDLVKSILIEYPETRNSDKLLMWYFYRKTGLVKSNLFSGGEYIGFVDFVRNATPPETIRRSRADIQRLHREKVGRGEIELTDSLLALPEIEKLRMDKASEKGTHIYRETTS